MESRLKLNASGKLFIKIEEDGKIILNTTVHNNILPQAYSILSQRLIGYEQAKLDTISAYKAGSLLGIAPVIEYSYNSNTNETDVKALFSNTSFNNTLDELRLSASGLPADFAKVTGVSLTKTNTQQLLITWRIKIF